MIAQRLPGATFAVALMGGMMRKTTGSVNLPAAAALAMAVLATAALAVAPNRPGQANVAPTHASVDAPRLALTLPDGRTAALQGARYRLTDAQGRVLIDRAARRDDVLRLTRDAVAMTRRDPASRLR